MKYKISDDRKTLTICVDEQERQELREIQSIGADVTMRDFLSPITCNSDLEWMPEGATSDLTSAPMLGVLGDEGCRQHWALREHFGLVESGQSDHSTLYRGIVERWAFMDYQVRSVLEDLRDKGEAVFIS